MLRAGLHQEGAGQVVREDVVSYGTKMDGGDEGVGIVLFIIVDLGWTWHKFWLLVGM